METTNIVDFTRRDGMSDALTELLKTGAQQLIATAVEAELVSYPSADLVEPVFNRVGRVLNSVFFHSIGSSRTFAAPPRNVRFGLLGSI